MTITLPIDRVQGTSYGSVGGWKNKIINTSPISESVTTKIVVEQISFDVEAIEPLETIKIVTIVLNDKLEKGKLHYSKDFISRFKEISEKYSDYILAVKVRNYIIPCSEIINTANTITIHYSGPDLKYLIK